MEEKILKALLLKQETVKMSWEFQHVQRASINVVTLHAKDATYDV